MHIAEARHIVREYLHNQRKKLSLDKRTLTLIFIVCASLARSVCAQRPPRIAIAPKPVGSGARALGQSAFIAVADDATAASWNPAGLINLERPEASFVGAWKVTTYDYSSVGNNILVDPDSWGGSEINFMSYAHPLQVENTDVVLSVNYHQVYDFGLEINYMLADSEEPLIIKGRSEGAISAYSTAGGVSIPSHPEVTIGASFNWYTQSLHNDDAWQVKQRVYWREEGGSDFELYGTETETYDDFQGHNFTFGLLWDAYEEQENLLTLGFVCHTPFTAELNREVVFARPDRPPPPTDRRRWEMDFPLSLGAGANYRFSDRRSAAFDVEWKNWSEFEQTNLDTGERTSPIGGGDGDIADTLAFRLGFEHLSLPEGAEESVFALRHGMFYEPRPALDDPLEVYGFSAGLGWTFRERFSLDFAYQFRWGEEVSGRNLGEGRLENIDYGIEEHFYVVSLVTYF